MTAKTLPARTVRGREKKNKMKRGCQTPTILLAGNRLIKLLGCEHMLLFIKKET